MPIKYIRPRKEELLLLLLTLNNNKPIKGILRLHYMCFLYHYFGFKFIFGPCGPYSIELMNMLKNLINNGLVRVYIALDSKGNLVKTFSLTDYGRRVAAATLDRIRRHNVLLEDVVVRKGSEVVSEIEAIKKTYYNKPLTFILLRILQLIKREWPYWVEADERVKEHIGDVVEEISPYLYG